MAKYDIYFEVEAEDIQDAAGLVYRLIDKYDFGRPEAIGRFEITEQTAPQV